MERDITDILPIPLGKFGAYYATINMRESGEFRKERQRLEEMGVYKISGYNDVLLLWIKAEDKNDLEKRKDKIKEFVGDIEEKIYKMYIEIK